jgi:outer membrane immunogenic protein
LQLLHAELVLPAQSPDRSPVGRFGSSGDGMKLRRTLTLAGMGLWGCLWGMGALAAPAAAHPPPDDYVPYHPSGFFVFNWSGFYVGGSLGAAHTLADSPVTLADDFVQNFASLSSDILNYEQSETSLTGGVHAGWQKHWGRLVVGIEAGFNVLSFNTTTESPLVPFLRRTAELRDILSLTGRLGYADGRWLAYAKGGLVNAEIGIGYDDGLTGISSSSSGRETGWTAGVGIDYALTQNLFLGVEYNYLHFRADATLPQIPDVLVHVADADIDVQNVVVRLNYRFSAACCPGPAGP